MRMHEACCCLMHIIDRKRCNLPQFTDSHARACNTGLVVYFNILVLLRYNASISLVFPGLTALPEFGLYAC